MISNLRTKCQHLFPKISQSDNHNESSYIRSAVAPCQTVAEVLHSRLSGQASLSKPQFDYPSQEVESSTSDSVKCKSRIDTACDGRLNSPQSANCDRFGLVAQRDLEVFEKYSQLCAKNTAFRISSDTGRTTNVGS
nr:hypothetical protein [Tanacetum cinerariifolium]